MIIAQITGGLGNQMFQYAAAKALSLHLHAELKLDIQSFKREILPELDVERNFELTAFKEFDFQEASKDEIRELQKESLLGKKLEKIIPPYKRRVYSEKDFSFDPNFFKAKYPVYIRGHRQSEQYFYPYREQIKQIFVLPEIIFNNVFAMGEKMKFENSLAVHVRRGDFLRLPIILDWHGVLEKNYYAKGIEIIRDKVDNLKIYYFSDDIDWIKKELLPEFPGEIISESISKNHYQDFYLMSQCKHNIIANSSFSWWAAWLNNHKDKKVIAPKKWFNNAPLNYKDVIPENWIKL